MHEAVKAMIDLRHGDCLELMKDIPDGSVDLVLTDPPYGTMKGFNDKFEWDTILDTETMFNELSRVLRQNGKAILFSQEPYTSHLINNAIVPLPFSYRMIWLKNTCGNARMAKKATINIYEDIVLFQNKCPNKENCEATIAFQKVIDKYGFYKIADLMYQEGRYKDVASARKNLSKKKINDFTERDYDNFLDRKMLLFLANNIDLGFSPDWYLKKAKEYKKNTQLLSTFGKAANQNQTYLNMQKTTTDFTRRKSPLHFSKT